MFDSTKKCLTLPPGCANSGLLTTEPVKIIFKEMFEEQWKALVNIVSQNAIPF